VARIPKTAKTGSGARRTNTAGGSRQLLWIALGGATVVAVALIAGSLLWSGGDDGPSEPAASDTALVDGIPQEGTTLGASEAKVMLIQWEDFQCPACGAYQDLVFPAIVDEYVRPGKVKVEFMGLTFIGEDSEQALRAALAAGRQGRFWQMEKLLYDNQGGENGGWVTDELIRELATAIGLDVERLEADMSSQAVTEQIEAMSTEGNEQEVAGTPTFFVSIGGDAPYLAQPGALDPAAFRPILDGALAG
jgi:protein-disulfide isomerase